MSTNDAPAPRLNLLGRHDRRTSGFAPNDFEGWFEGCLRADSVNLESQISFAWRKEREASAQQLGAPLDQPRRHSQPQSLKTVEENGGGGNTSAAPQMDRQRRRRSQLAGWDRVGDPVADAAIKALKDAGGGFTLARLRELGDAGNADCAALLRQYDAVPSWVDWDAVESGQLAFLKRGVGCAVSLLYLALVGGMGYEELTTVLACTGRLTESHKVTRRRIYETASMVLDCVQDPANLRPGGKATTTLLEVRLLHARVRAMVLNRADVRAKVADGGTVPISQVQLSLVLLAFSVMVLIGLGRLGMRVRSKEQLDMMHMWRLVGYYLGIHDACNSCTTADTAMALLSASCHNQYRPSAQCSAVANHLLESLAVTGPLAGPLWLHREAAWVLMGPAMAERIGISPPFDGKGEPRGWLQHALAAGARRIGCSVTCFSVYWALWLGGWVATSCRAGGYVMARLNGAAMGAVVTLGLEGKRPKYELWLPPGHA